MGDIELSLDDIIKRTKKTSGTNRGKNNARILKKPTRRIFDQTNRGNKNQNVGIATTKNFKNPNMKITRGQGVKANIGDARLKIIQKQRQKVKDAREKLGQIAKQTDARLRLIKLRERQRVLSAGRITDPVRLVPEHHILQRTVQSRFDNLSFEGDAMDYTIDVAYSNRNFSERVLMDDGILSYQYRGRQEAPILYRTVENDLPSSRAYEEEKDIYSWTKPKYVSHMNDVNNIPVPKISSRIGGIRNDDKRETVASTPNWDLDEPIVVTKKVKPQETVGILKRSSSRGLFEGPAVKVIKEASPPTKSRGSVKTLSERFCQDGNVLAQKINQLKAKLEASQKNVKNHSSESQAPLGHRIVVSNLVPSVTHEDVKELFEDIGELISSKVVRPGTAEVVYKLHKDAVKAVDVYHNRQLDGQPMKCLLVNNRLRGEDRKIGKSVVEVDMTAFRKALHKKSTS